MLGTGKKSRLDTVELHRQLAGDTIKREDLTAGADLAAFYASLGEAGYAEQQVATLFALATRHGLAWNQGDYQDAYDAGADVVAYHIELPIKGGDRAIWAFCAALMRAIPYAALDEISFKREQIGDTEVEAHLRLTLYYPAASRGRP